MFGIETQGGKSGGQKAGLLLNITERGSEAGNGREEEERESMTNISERVTECHSV